MTEVTLSMITEDEEYRTFRDMVSSKTAGETESDNISETSSLRGGVDQSLSPAVAAAAAAYLAQPKSTGTPPPATARAVPFKLGEEIDKNNMRNQMRDQFMLDMQRSSALLEFQQDIEDVLEQNYSDSLSLGDLFKQMANRQGVLFAAPVAKIVDNDLGKAVKLYTNSLGVKSRLNRALAEQGTAGQWTNILGADTRFQAIL